MSINRLPVNRAEAIQIARGCHQEYGVRGTIRLVRVTWKHRQQVKPALYRAMSS